MHLSERETERVSEPEGVPSRPMINRRSPAYLMGGTYAAYQQLLVPLFDIFDQLPDVYRRSSQNIIACFVFVQNTVLIAVSTAICRADFFLQEWA